MLTIIKWTCFLGGGLVVPIVIMVLFSSWLYNVCRGIEHEVVRSRQLPKSTGCGKNFTGKMKLVSHEKVRYWMLQLASELCDRLKGEQDKVSSFTSLYFTSLHFTSLHFTSRHVTSRHFTSRHFTSRQWRDVTWSEVTWSKVMWREVTWRDMTWSEVTSLHFMSRHVTSRHFTSCHVTSLHFTSLHFTSLYFVESSNGKISISWTEDRKWNLCCKVIPIKKCWRTINLWLCNASDKEFQFRQWRHLVSFPNSEI